MGCDIHPTWEVYTKSGKWMPKGGVSCLSRDYNFFALIADVRNDGSAHVHPFYCERGVPDDSKQSLIDEFEECCDYHSPSHFYLNEFKHDYENEMDKMVIDYSVKYSLLLYYKKVKGTLTGNEANGLWNINKYTEMPIRKFDELLNDESIKCMLELNTMPKEYKDKFARIVNEVPYHEEFGQTYKEIMQEAKARFKSKKLEDIRITYWFDN